MTEKDEVKNMRIYLERKLHHALKIHAANEEMTMQEVITEALKSYIPKELWDKN